MSLWLVCLVCPLRLYLFTFGMLIPAAHCTAYTYRIPPCSPYPYPHPVSPGARLSAHVVSVIVSDHVLLLIPVACSLLSLVR